MNAPTRHVFIDCETTGLDPARHEVWEVAWAGSNGPIVHGVVPHSIVTADPDALRLNGYHDRQVTPSADLDYMLREVLTGATIVAANPAFDTAFLARRWGVAPWHYRLVDIETLAMPLLGMDRPRGLATICDALGVDAPDHTAAGDVRALRECWHELRYRYRHVPTTDPDLMEADQGTEWGVRPERGLLVDRAEDEHAARREVAHYRDVWETNAALLRRTVGPWVEVTDA